MIHRDFFDISRYCHRWEISYGAQENAHRLISQQTEARAYCHARGCISNDARGLRNDYYISERYEAR